RRRDERAVRRSCVRALTPPRVAAFNAAGAPPGAAHPSNVGVGRAVRATAQACAPGKQGATTMAVAERHAEGDWEGNLFQGHGTLQGGSGALPDLPVTWAARAERPDGKTSPEELIAAAHAACYAMAFSNTLDKAGTPPERLHVSATCTLDRVGG